MFFPELDDHPHSDELQSAVNYRSLKPSKMLEGHEGCVNSVSWNPDGRLIATGSDDLHLGIWSYPDGQLLSRTMTQHDDNIFSSSWLPSGSDSSGTSTTIATCSRDGLVGLFRLRPDTAVPMLGQMYSCHHDSAMRIATDTCDPNLFFSCSRDGAIRQFDIRQQHRCSGSCANAVLSAIDEQIGWNSISLSPLRPEYLAVGGVESAALVYDRRMLSTGHDSDPTVKRAFERHLHSWIPDIFVCAKQEVSSVAFSPTSLELAVSYNRGSIYLCNLLDRSHYLQKIHKENPYCKERAFINERQIYKDFKLLIDGDPVITNRASGLVARLIRASTKHLSYSRSDFGFWKALAVWELYNAAAVSKTLGKIRKAIGLLQDAIRHLPDELPLPMLKLMIDLSPHDPDLVRYLESYLISNSLSIHDIKARYLSEYGLSDLIDFHGLDVVNRLLNFDSEQERTIIGYHCNYSKHNSTQTVKDVYFVGSKGQFIATGSDLGYFFLYDKETSETVYLGAGDRHVNNVVQGHPSLPVLATSGIESTVKIWEPEGTLLPSDGDDEAIPRRIDPDQYDAIYGVLENAGQSEGIVCSMQ